jgi:hypothetical protein
MFVKNYHIFKNKVSENEKKNNSIKKRKKKMKRKVAKEY